MYDKTNCPTPNNNNISDTNQLHDIALVKLDRPILQEEWDNLNGQSGPEYIRDDFVNHAEFWLLLELIWDIMQIYKDYI